jgi:Phage Tail Collar Domain
MAQLNFPSPDNYNQWDEWAKALLRGLQFILTGTTVTDVGHVASFFGPTVPTGWLPCNGQVFDKQSYPTLFITLGNSDVLPNLVSPFGAGYTVGIKSGSV